MDFFAIESDARFKGSQLILPSPNGIAYLGQLAVDLMIASVRMKRVGFLDCSQIQQVVGMDSYGQWDQNAIRTAMEVYQTTPTSSDKRVLTVIQIRSNVYSGRGIAFSEALALWIQQQEFESVLLLTGLDGTRRTDAQLTSESHLRFHLPKASLNTPFTTKLNALDWIPLEPSQSLYTDNPVAIPPGAGLTRFIVDYCVQKAIPVLVLSWFTVEGDNMAAVHAFMDSIDQLLGLTTIEGNPLPKWLKPKSWDLIYGPKEFAPELF